MMIQKIFKPILMPSAWQDFIISIPRWVYGYYLATDFGASKFGMPWSPPENGLGLFEIAFWFPADVEAFGAPFSWAPAFFAWMAGFTEAVGGIMWILGFNVRIFSFLIICTMFVAAFCQQSHNGFWNMMPSLGILFISLFYLVQGSGRLGVDYFISKKF